MIKKFLENKKKSFEKYMNSKIPNRTPKEVYEVVFEYINRGGKRFRPALVNLGYGLIKPNTKKFPKGVDDIGIAIEFFHNFTLIHDDIEDNSLQRRGKPTLHLIHGTPIAINAGDGLFCLVFKVLSDSKNLTDKQKVYLLSLFSKYFLKVLEGQAIELSFYKENKWDITDEDYFNMVYGKTASLFELSLLSGAYLAGADKKQMEKISTYAKKTGIAFQIQDDVLNIIGNFKKYKKEIGGDISEGKRTLMTIDLMKKLPENKKNDVKKILSENTKCKKKINKIINLLKENKSVNYAIKIANQYVESSKEQLDYFNDSKYKELLLDLSNLFITREQ